MSLTTSRCLGSVGEPTQAACDRRIAGASCDEVARGIVCSVAMAVAITLASARAFAVTPEDSGTISPLFPVPINTSAGDQFDPHVSGDIVSYTAASGIRHYSFFSAADQPVPPLQDAVDNLSDVNDGRIVFSRFDAEGGNPVLLYDIAADATAEIAPVALPIRTNSAIGGDTVAFVDLGLTPGGEISVGSTSSPGSAAQRITNDARLDRQPSVSPSGELVVYQSCVTSASNCDIHQAARSGSSWIVTPLTNNAEHESNSDTDGVAVVYHATRAGENDIYWQPVGGGTEMQLVLPGEQRNPSISAGVVLFESIAVGETEADLYFYEIATNRLFQITDTPVDESLNDIAALATGDFRVVWSSGEIGDRDVHGATFAIPLVPAPVYSFGGLLQPIDPLPVLNAMKAGAAVPVKFSLGGYFGLGIFASGYPKSEAIECSSTVAVDGVEQTVTAGASNVTYDAATDVYSYTWKTDKNWAGSCRQLVIGLTDGARYRANFKFK